MLAIGWCWTKVNFHCWNSYVAVTFYFSRIWAFLWLKESKVLRDYQKKKKKQTDGHYIASKIDRVLGNDSWFKPFPLSHVYFCLAGLSDHSPAILCITPKGTSYRQPFKYFNFWADHKEFILVVRDVWCKYEKGSPMFRICCKLRSLKPLLRGLNKREFSDLSSRVLCAKFDSESAQIKLDKDPMNLDLQATETTLCKKYIDLCNAEESLAHQKSRIQWLSLKDRNSSFFFRSVRNNWTEAESVPYVVQMGRTINTCYSSALSPLRFRLLCSPSAKLIGRALIGWVLLRLCLENARENL